MMFKLCTEDSEKGEGGEKKLVTVFEMKSIK